MSRILIIDDEIENLNALKRALGDENPYWEILIATNEKVGIDILEQQLKKKSPVDVVLTDLVLESEERGGMNVLLKAQQIDPLIMAILFTAKEKNLDRYAAFEYGAFDVVEKNIRGTFAVREINIKTRAALRYREWSQRINFLRRYFDPKVFKVIENDSSLLALNRRMLTVVFWDIRGFSGLCEILKAYPDLIAGFLREYYEMAAKIIFAHDGVLDNLIGDGVMAIFGVLNHKDAEGSQDAVLAVEAAIELRNQFSELLERWIEKWNMYVANKIDIGIGCGIHTGESLCGNIGTDFRDQFTALGPHVNLASRIQSKSKQNEILISETTQKRVKTYFQFTKIEQIDDVKNIPGSFTLYRIESKNLS